MKYLSLAALSLLLLGAGLARAQVEQDFVEDLRDSVREAFDPARAGIFYAASINFALQPDIATAKFSLDGLEDSGVIEPELVNSRLPLRYTFDMQRDDLRGFVQATIGYQDLSMAIPLVGEEVRVDWRSRGIDIGAGVEYQISEYWKVLPSINLGIGELRNKANYGDSVLGPILQPIFEGVIFDWNTRAWVAGAAVGARYERRYDGFRLLTNLSASANHVRSFDESSPDIIIQDTASTLDLSLNTIHPIGQMGSTRVDLVTVLGATSLVGDARGELGFNEFAEFGLALQFDIKRFGMRIDGLRIGAKAIVGQDVSGWSVIIGQSI